MEPQLRESSFDLKPVEEISGFVLGEAGGRDDHGILVGDE